MGLVNPQNFRKIFGGHYPLNHSSILMASTGHSSEACEAHLSSSGVRFSATRTLQFGSKHNLKTWGQISVQRPQATHLS